MIIGLTAFNLHYDIPEMLEHWLSYNKTNFDKIMLVLLAHNGGGDTDSALVAVQRAVSQYRNVEVYQNQIVVTDSGRSLLARTQIFFKIATTRDLEDSWLCPSDIDEFVQWPVSIGHTLKMAKLSNANAIAGELRDRTTIDGTPIDLRDGDPLARCQYEWELTQYEQRQHRKVVAVRGGIAPSVGNHMPILKHENPIEPAIVWSTHYRNGNGIRVYNELTPVCVNHISWHTQRLKQLGSVELPHLIKATELHRKHQVPPIRISRGGRARIRNIAVRATNVCNFHCTGCITLSPLIGNKSPLELPLMLNVLKKLGDVSSLMSINILGGEPFLKPDIGAFIRAAYEAGRPWGNIVVTTNGSILMKNPKLIEALPKDVPTELVVSLHPELMNMYTREQITGALFDAQQYVGSNVSIGVRDVSHYRIPVFVRRNAGAINHCTSIKYRCINLTETGLSFCDRTNPHTAKFDYEMSPEACAELPNSLLPITDATSAKDVYDWYYTTQNICAFCSGDESVLRHNGHENANKAIEGDFFVIPKR